MKRSHDAIGAHRWCLDARVRLALYVPMDSVRRSVVAGLRSVYYCPAPPDAAGTGMLIDGLHFDLYALAEDTVSDEQLYNSLFFGYLFSEMVDKDRMLFPSTSYGEALVLAHARKDPDLCTVATVSAGEQRALGSIDHAPFREAKKQTRLVRIRTRSHALFSFVVDRYSRNDELVRNRRDPDKKTTHAFLLLCMMRDGPRPPRGGKSAARPPHKTHSVPSLRLAREYTIIELLTAQMTLSVADFARLCDYEHALIVKDAKERALRSAGGGDLGLTYMADGEGGAARSEVRDLSAFTPGPSQVYVSVARECIVPCSGMLVPGTVRMPRGLEGDVNVPHVHRAFGTKPWLLEAPVPYGQVHQMVGCAALTFQRAIGMVGAARVDTIRFKTHEDIVRDYVPPPPPRPPKATAAKKRAPPRAKVPAPVPKSAPAGNTAAFVSMLLRGPLPSLKPVKFEQ